MDADEILGKIKTIVQSEDFKKRLAVIQKNLFNLKLEMKIRDLIVEMFNETYSIPTIRAIAEHPRYHTRRIDFSVCREKVVLFAAEFKYSFNGDFRKIKNNE